MKKIDNLKDLKSEKETIKIDIPKNTMAMAITFIFIDDKNEIRLITNNVDTQKLKGNN